ncbi:MAG: hypothetical protein R3E87_11405 [Burkholderiaceae bacterium]
MRASNERLMGFRKPPAQTVFGNAIPEPKMTAYAWWWLFTRVLLPITIVGSLLDFAAQWLFGVCVGLWCLG